MDGCVISLDKRSKFSRKRANEDEGDITYINERNRVFNKKVRFGIIWESCSSLNIHLFALNFLADLTLLRQVHDRDPRKLRAGHSIVEFTAHAQLTLWRW
jgi:hypothetical protein